MGVFSGLPDAHAAFGHAPEVAGLFQGGSSSEAVEVGNGPEGLIFEETETIDKGRAEAVWPAEKGRDLS
ncbi:MAG: hypothetical protein M1299_13285 [Firmicutes bacterium]|nr:hypothetical protein [Bacillota bacterium]